MLFDIAWAYSLLRGILDANIGKCCFETDSDVPEAIIGDVDILKDAPLDMRFNMDSDFSAYDVVNTYSEQDLIKVFSEYGEERFSKRIAKAIIQNRPINTTLEFFPQPVIQPILNIPISPMTIIFFVIYLMILNINFIMVIQRKTNWPMKIIGIFATF